MEPTTMDTLFGYFDISGLSANVVTVMGAMVTLGIVFLGYRALKKAGKLPF